MAYTTVKRFHDESRNVEKLKQRKHDELKKVLDAVYTQALHFYEKNKDSMERAELELAIADMVAGARYDGSNYIWINDMTPVMIMHPTSPALNGKDLTGFKDPAGTFLFNEMVAVCKQDGEGVVSYQWAKPGEDTPKPQKFPTSASCPVSTGYSVRAHGLKTSKCRCRPKPWTPSERCGCPTAAISGSMTTPRRCLP